MPKSHRPHSPHPNAHTEQELKWIRDYHRRNPNISPGELYGKLREDKTYSRHPGSLYRVFIWLGYRKKPESTKKKSKHLGKYDAPSAIGINWQMDVKYVPMTCYAGKEKRQFYTGADGEAVSWPQTGSMDMDHTRFPDGLAEIGADAEKHDMMYLLWFEPENMRLDVAAFLKGQPDFKEEWLLGTVGAGSWLEGRLMNLGDPGCREWIFEKICRVIDTAGVTAYRQDFNNDPAVAWQENDQKTPNRSGMTENLYAQGYLALWDALIEKYGIFIDSCASGGGRNDLESMKRGVPLHYSDWFDGNNGDSDMKGKMSQALFAWFPYFKNELYTVNTMYEPHMNYAMFSMLKVSSPPDKGTKWELLRQAYAEYDPVREYFYDDFYRLTDRSADRNRWDARMFFDPVEGKGFVSVACQADAAELTRAVHLKGLEPETRYHIKDLDGLVDTVATGRELTEAGVSVTVPEKPYCAILMIEPAK